MKIDNPVKNVAGLSVGGGVAQRSGKAGGATRGAGGTNQETVELSRLSSHLQTVGNGLVGENVVLDATRIQEIKQAISEGRFKVNAEVVADRLLDTVRELLQAHRMKSQ